MMKSRVQIALIIVAISGAAGAGQKPNHSAIPVTGLPKANLSMLGIDVASKPAVFPRSLKQIRYQSIFSTQMGNGPLLDQHELTMFV